MNIHGENIVHDAMRIRGFFITDTIAIERAIGSYLSQYFCREPKYRQKELLELIMSSDAITFDKKKNILKVILKKHIPNLDKAYPNLFPYLNSIIEHRNIFAHYLLDTSKAAIRRYPKEIGFIKYKNDTTTIWFDNNQLSEHLKKHFDCLNIIIEIFKKGVY